MSLRVMISMHSPTKYIIASLVIVITVLHYTADPGLHFYHLILHELYLLPIALAGLLLGSRGALATSLCVTALYLPFVILRWQGFSPVDLYNLIQIPLFNGLALILGVLRNRQRSAQTRIRELENLAAVGKVMSSVAHDMKTPLIAIGGFSRQVQKDLEHGSPGFQKLEIVLRETYRLECMMKDMLDFARPMQLERKQEDLNELVSECIGLVEAESKRGEVREAPFQANLDRRIPTVFIDSMRLKRAIINIITNAVQASPPGEPISILTHREGNRIMLDIRDRGPGIPKEHMDKIFDPFFTTKKEGTGLGLSISKKILEAHGGDLAVVGNSERGTTFRLVFPVD